jgi:predicted phosphodiesterase
MYRRFKALGIEEVVHAGDVATGQNVYKGQLNDILCFGWSDHKKYVVENYPQVEGITTYFIEGNHDQDYTINFGAHFGEEIAAERPDMKFVGIYDAPITINGVRIGLHHGSRGVPYALSYHLQKFIEKIEGGQKPQIYFLGHYHASLYTFYRNIHAYLAGCFQRPNSYSIRNGLPNLVCGWIAEMEVRKKKQNGYHTIDALRMTSVPFF